MRVTVTVDDELELLSSDLIGDGFVQIEQGTGTPFNLRIKPRSVVERIYIAASLVYISLEIFMQ